MKFSLGSALLIVGAVVGLVTGINSLSNAGQKPVDGRWAQGVVNAKDSAALYATGHFRQDGLLPPSHNALYYTRLVDDEGKSLRSSCAYLLAGAQPQARWWSVTAAPQASAASQASLTARDIVLTGDDQFSVAISRKAAPGNWLKVEDFGAMRVVLVLQEPGGTALGAKPALPSLKRLGCD